MRQCALCVGAVLLAVSLSSCAYLTRTNAQKPLPGKRISVLTLENQLETDPSMADTQVVLPPPVANADWREPGGVSTNTMSHLALGPDLKMAWAVKVGEGKAGTSRILAPPIVADGKVFTLDAQSTVTAVDAGSGATVWSRALAPKKEDKDAGFGGGIAVDGGRVYVASGFGFVVALDPATGKDIWHHSIGVPTRAAPVVDGGRVFVLSEDNQIFVLDANDGREDWNFQGIVETARILSNPSVAVAGDVVIVPFSSGELFALRVENGHIVWSDTLTRTGPQTAISTLSDIAGRPAVDRGMVFAVSHSGPMAGIDIRTGERVWSVTLASADTPWSAGDFVYVLTVDNEMICLSRMTGKIKWVSQLPRYKNEKDKSGPIEWSGPVLAGGRLMAVSSLGTLLSVAPETGKIGAPITLPAGTFVPPVVAGGTLYVLTGDARLVALR